MSRQDSDVLSHVSQARRGMIWCGACYEGMRGRAYHRGHFGGAAVSLERWVRMGRLLGKKPETVKEAPGTIPEPVAGLLVVMPGIWEYLTLRAWEGGKKRVPSKITIFVENGVVKLALNDLDVKQSLYVSGETLEQALHALERKVQEGSDDWRPWNK